MRKIPVILDGDPGHDDAIAWMLAKAIPEMEILAVCSSAGNQIPDKTTYNAQKICALLKIQAPCARGAERPLVSELVTAGNWHGETGLDGAVLPDPVPLSELPASELMAQAIAQSETPVTIISTGPLTNAAQLLITYPELKEKIAGISFMGGGIVRGNWIPAAEFNILEDPEAADLVFRSGIPLTMCGLDVTELAQILPADIDRIRSVGNAVSDVVADWVKFFICHSMEIGYAGAPVHDPLAVLALVHPEMFAFQDYYVQIDLDGQYTRGETLADLRKNKPGEKNIPPNVRCAVGVDRERYIDLICAYLHMFDDPSEPGKGAALTETLLKTLREKPVHLLSDLRSSGLFSEPKYVSVDPENVQEGERIPVWIDTDAGTDDAVAILAAMSMPELDVVGISAVAGNVELEHTFRNARNLVSFAGKDIKVYPGAEAPLFRPLRTAKHVHGEKGLGSASLPDSTAPVETEKAWDALYRCAKQYSGKLDLVLVGPQTNAAIALAKYPDLAKHLHRILFMGGADAGGNATVAAEFNIIADPQAAERVLHSGVPTVMCGLDVTMQAHLTEQEYEEIRSIQTAKSAFLYEVPRNARTLFGTDGCCMHDICPLLYAAKPFLFKAVRAGVHVETRSSLTLGQTVTDWQTDVKFPEAQTELVLDLNREAFAACIVNLCR